MFSTHFPVSVLYHDLYRHDITLLLYCQESDDDEDIKGVMVLRKLEYNKINKTIRIATFHQQSTTFTF